MDERSATHEFSIMGCGLVALTHPARVTLSGIDIHKREFSRSAMRFTSLIKEG
jgi:hypothetical protein